MSHNDSASTPTSALSDEPPSSGYSHDINFAAALRAQYAIETPTVPRRRHRRAKKAVTTTNPEPAKPDAEATHNDEQQQQPLVDNTTVLPLHSKKTQRLQKRQQQRDLKAAAAAATAAGSRLHLLDLPSELLAELLTHLTPSDLLAVARTNHTLRTFVSEHENALTTSIIRRCYWTLYRCFPRPVPFRDVPPDAHASLLNRRRLEMLNIHRKSYHQHIQMVDPHAVCMCMTCVFAWNNLCLVLDLHHWQRNLENREPIPVIARGVSPLWNQELLERHAQIVRMAMERPLVYAWILQKHLNTITRTIVRFGKWKKKGEKTPSKPRLYHLTNAEIEAGTDEFLERSGPPSYDFPFNRDNYYTIEAYLPNRKFGADGKWHYYALTPPQHERDLEWVKSTFTAPTSRE